MCYILPRTPALSGSELEMLSATLLDSGPFVVIDIETTGSRPGCHSIIEIGAVKIAGGVVVDEFETLVTPHDELPAAVSHLTGITPQDLMGAQRLGDALMSLKSFVEGAVVVAHSHRFDLGFLDYEFERHFGGPLHRPVIDTLMLANRLHPDSARNNLKDLAARYGVQDVPTHRALSDARATASVFLGMLPALVVRGITTAGEVTRWCGMSSQTALSRSLPLTTELPDAPGVYLFRDDAGEVVHVGRARSLRTKVRSYFYATGGGGRHADIGVDVASIEWLPAISGLDLLLLESRLVTRYRPRHNAVVLRGDRGGWSLHARGGAFPPLRVVAKPPRGGRAVGPFVNRQSVETLAEMLRSSFGLRRCGARLDERLAAKPCQHRDAASCPAPCVAGIGAPEYESRVQAALDVFDGGATAWRDALAVEMDRAAAAQGYEEATRFRDALRAYDRCASAIVTVRRAAESLGSVVVERDNGSVAAHFLRRGYLLRTIRLSLDDGAIPAPVERTMLKMLQQRYCEDSHVSDPRRFTSGQLRDIFLIASYRSQHGPREVELSGEAARDLSAVAAAVRAGVRISRRPRPDS